MRLGICIAVKDRSYQVVQSDPPEAYDHIKKSIQLTPSDQLEPPEVSSNGDITITPLPTLLKSLARIHQASDDWHVIITDFGSTDIDIHHLCELHLGDTIPFSIAYDKSPFFNRGGGLDVAAQIARENQCDTLFFCDADMYFTGRYVFDEAQRTLAEGKVYYPVCFSYTDPSHQFGYWRDTGYGMVFIRTIDYFHSQRWKNNQSWGWEDRAFYEGLPPERIKRDRAPGLFHQWHPNSIQFKTQHYPIKHYVKEGAIF
jgi:hypothetical protein